MPCQLQLTLDTGLNCKGPLIRGFLSLNTYYSTTGSTVEFKDAEPWIWEAQWEVIWGCFHTWRVGTPNPHIFQESTVFLSQSWIHNTHLKTKPQNYIQMNSMQELNISNSNQSLTYQKSLSALTTSFGYRSSEGS